MEYRDTWIERALFPFVRVVLRLAWTWPWLALLSQLFLPGRRPGTSLLALIGLATMGYTIGKVGRRVKSVPAIKGLVLVLFAIGAVLTTSWFLIYRSIVPLLDPIWLRDLGLEITQGGGMMVRRVLAILAGAFVCVSGMLDAEDPPDHAAIWASFTTTITLLVIHASLVELVPDLRIAPPTPWLVLVFALGMIALLASGSRLGQRIEPRVPRPWQIG